MTQIYQTENFIVEAFERPHVDRLDGGHIKIAPKVLVTDRTQLAPKLAIELMRLTMLVGEAMAIGMNNRGVDVGRVNYQDMGNWSVFKPDGPYFHIHLYGRAKSAKFNKWGDAVFAGHRDTGFYDNFKPLNDEDIAEIQKQISLLEKQDKYKLAEWGLE